MRVSTAYAIILHAPISAHLVRRLVMAVQVTGCVASIIQILVWSGVHHIIVLLVSIVVMVCVQGYALMIVPILDRQPVMVLVVTGCVVSMILIPA
jgi:hypothetical protein